MMSGNYYPPEFQPYSYNSNPVQASQSFEPNQFSGAVPQQNFPQTVDYGYNYESGLKKTGMSPSKSARVLNQYFDPMGEASGKGPNIPYAQDDSAYMMRQNQTMDIRSPVYESARLNQGNQSLISPQQILTKKIIQPDDLRSHPGYESIVQMRNPMYANYNYHNRQAPSNFSTVRNSPKKDYGVQDSLDLFKNEMMPQQNRAPEVRRPLPEPNTYATEDPNQYMYNAPKTQDIPKKETISYFGEGMNYNQNTENKGYLFGLASPKKGSERNELNMGSPTKRSPHEIYVFNPLTQSPQLRYKRDPNAFNRNQQGNNYMAL